MGGNIVPPYNELMNAAYASRQDKADLWWRNVFEAHRPVDYKDVVQEWIEASSKNRGGRH